MGENSDGDRKSKLRILIVEDEKGLGEFLQIFFGLNHLRTHITENCQEALKYLEENGLNVPVMITDMHFPKRVGDSPERNGIALIKEVNRRWPHIRFVGTSGNATNEEMEFFKRKGSVLLEKGQTGYGVRMIAEVRRQMTRPLHRDLLKGNKRGIRFKSLTLD